jgi:hypothetical protein
LCCACAATEGCGCAGAHDMAGTRPAAVRVMVAAAVDSHHMALLAGTSPPH